MEIINQVTLEEVRQALEILGQPDSEFSDWVRRIHRRENAKLGLILQGVINSGVVSNNVEALVYLSASPVSKNHAHKIGLIDIQRKTGNQKLMQMITELVTGNKLEAGQYDASRAYGIESHITINRLFSGHLINIDRVPKKNQNGFFIQWDLFDENDYDIGFIREHKKSSRFRTRLLMHKFVENIETRWREIHKEMNSGNFQMYIQNYVTLREKLGVIFERHAVKIANYGIFQNERLEFLTLMSWAGALLYYREHGNMILFQETFLLPYRADLGLGRLDALQVIKIGGETPSEYQNNRLRKLTERKFSSVGHLIKILVDMFEGQHLEFKILDWKFAAGDSVHGMRNEVNAIETGEVTTMAMPKHADQIKRYITASYLSYALVTSKTPNIDSIWSSDKFSIVGEILYFMPDCLPISHSFSLTSEEMRGVFNELGSKVVHSHKSSFSRKTGNSVARYAFNTMKGKRKKHTHGHQLGLNELVTETDRENHSPHKVIKLIKGSYVRKFLDHLQIIEIVTTPQGDEYRLHVDRFYAALERGDIEFGRRWNDVQGGFVKCWMHGERTGSFSINFIKGVWKCFGQCGIGGKFAVDSIPDDMSLVVNTSPRKMIKDLRSISIPERHEEIMLAAQEIMQIGFLDSPGAKYLEDVRGLNPEISMSIGAGYADELLPIKLLERGFTYDELIYYGFLRISSNVRQNSSLVENLQHHGLLFEQIQKMIIVDKKLKQEPGLPYSILQKRVTYPLKIQWKINSFYGRSVDLNCVKDFLHTKLSTEHNNMPHGAFHLDEAMAMGQDLLIVEAPIDTDTFYQCSDMKSVGGIIGVANHPLLQIIGDTHNGNIFFGYDNDPKKEDGTGETGQKATAKAVQILKQGGSKSKMYDFTKAFTDSHPGVFYKDANRYWTDNRKRIDVHFSLLSGNAKPL